MGWNKQGCLTKGDLKQRGWTDTLINEFLGAPDWVKSFRYGEAHMYTLIRVTTAEEKSEFLAAKQISQERKTRASKAVETRRQKTLAKIADMRLPQLPPEVLIKRAIVHRNNHQMELSDYYGDREFKWADAKDIPLWPEVSDFRDRLCVNYLRHQSTSYDYLISVELTGCTGKQEAWRLWWDKFTQAVASQYPYLKDEAMRQKMARLAP